MSKLIHDKSQCIHCGTCVSVCPEFFEDNGEVILKNAEYNDAGVGAREISEDEKALAQSAVDCCPVQSIRLE